MNKRIDFTKNGGFPYTQDVFAFMQESFRDSIGGLASGKGDLVIVTGIQDLGTTYSDGWVIISGELMPFVGGLKQSQVLVEEITADETFGDDVVKTVYYTKRAKLGNTGGTPIASFVRQKTINELNTLLDTAMSHLVPQGMISMWSGAIVDIPSGWGLCDGTAGKPDLQGRFIVGYAGGEPDYSPIGKTGGAEFVTLDISQMPHHKHTGGATGASFVIKTGANTPGSLDASAGEIDTINVIAAVSEGGDQAHENRPPYYTLAYIIKL